MADLARRTIVATAVGESWASPGFAVGLVQVAALRRHDEPQPA